MKAQFANAVTNTLGVAKQSVLQTNQSLNDDCSGSFVLQLF
jgi:hypothetical protein